MNRKSEEELQHIIRTYGNLLLEKIQKPEIKELVKKQIALLVQLGDSLS